jgi:hypothetical protein
MTYLLTLALAAGILSGADVTGTWTGTLTPAGRDPGPAHLVLKQDGDKVTGTAGPSAGEQHAIENGKAADGTVTFDITTGGGVMKVSLTQNGDELAGDVTRERDGQTQHAKLAVKRAK